MAREVLKMAWRIEPEDPNELVTVAECTTQMELMLARARREDARIECFAADENTHRIMGEMSPMMLGLHGVRLQVRRSDLADAQALLSAPATDEDEEQFPPEPPDDIEPQ